ncbi:hypothetical protein VTN02DRAFT_4863 [Thermoascus thermophilus]
MASILRQIVAGPRSRHPETGLDLCYVTDNIIVTSGPSSTYPQRAYRNPTDALVRFLDSKHGADWTIWEFRAEGTGYPDSEVYGRIHHFPWPDHHPPPFALIPAIMASMRNWLLGPDDGTGEQPQPQQQQQQGEGKRKGGKRVAVVHCKAGKGRSGTVACSYLVSQEGWKVEDALRRFTERRMRAGFEGVSIPSQRRWVGYVDRWANEMGKTYVERPVEILEIHVWGLRDGVKIAVEGYVDEGKKIKTFHLFHRSERTVVDDGKSLPPERKRWRAKRSSTEPLSSPASSSTSLHTLAPASDTVTTPTASDGPEGSPTSPMTRISAVLLRPSKPVIVPTSDVNIEFERRSKAVYTGWTMVTSVAHVWFNAYFEGGDKHDSGVFETEWDALDGIKGSTQKGTRALDRVKVVWRYAPPSPAHVAEGRGPSREDRKNENVKPEEATTAGPALGKAISQLTPDEPVQDAFEGDDPAGLSSKNPYNASSQKKESSDETDIPETTIPATTTPAPAAAAAAATATPSPTTQQLPKVLGLRKQTPASEDVSLANSVEDLDLAASAKAKENKDTQRNKENVKIKENQKKDGVGVEVGEEPEQDPDLEAVRPYLGGGGGGGGRDGIDGDRSQ